MLLLKPGSAQHDAKLSVHFRHVCCLVSMLYASYLESFHPLVISALLQYRFLHQWIRGVRWLSAWQRKKSLSPQRNVTIRENKLGQARPGCLGVARIFRLGHSLTFPLSWIICEFLFLASLPLQSVWLSPSVCTSTSAQAFQICCVYQITASFCMGSAATCPILFFFCSLKQEAEKCWVGWLFVAFKCCSSFSSVLTSDHVSARNVPAWIRVVLLVGAGLFCW